VSAEVTVITEGTLAASIVIAFEHFLTQRPPGAGPRRAKPNSLPSDKSLAVPGLCVMPKIGSSSAPRVGVALAGVVHHRHCAARTEHHHRKDNQQGGIHLSLAAATPDTPTVQT
jgi:hypothetical protein